MTEYKATNSIKQNILLHYRKNYMHTTGLQNTDENAESLSVDFHHDLPFVRREFNQVFHLAPWAFSMF